MGSLRDEVIAEESKWHQMCIQERIIKAQVEYFSFILLCDNTFQRKSLINISTQSERVQREIHSYVSSMGGKKSFRDIYTKKIQEQDVSSKTLKERQKVIKDAHQPGLKQLDIWRDLQVLY